MRRTVLLQMGNLSENTKKKHCTVSFAREMLNYDKIKSSQKSNEIFARVKEN